MWVLALLISLAGCVSTAEQNAANQARLAANAADISAAKARKITFVEAARRINSRVPIAETGSVAPIIALSMSHRLALYSQVDAGQMSLETADYQINSEALGMLHQDQQREADRAAIVQAAAQARAVSCETQTGFGPTISRTVCH